MSQIILKLIREGYEDIVISGSNTPYILTEVKGLSGLTSTTRTYKAQNIPGATYKGSIFNIREIKINVEILVSSYNLIDDYKEALNIICNPDEGEFTLKIEKGTHSFIIPVVSDGLPEFNTRSYIRTSQGIITLLAMQPLLLSADELEINLNEWTGGMSYPFSFPISFAAMGDTIKNVINSGHANTPLTILIYGPATNPKIDNVTTGEYIQIIKEILAGEILIINTDISNDDQVKIIKEDGSIESASNYVDILCLPLFYLEKGDNVLSYTSEELSSNAVYVRYRNMYLGL